MDDQVSTLTLHLRCFEVAQELVRLEPDVAENHLQLSATLNNIAILVKGEPLFRDGDSIDLLRHAIGHVDRTLALAPNHPNAIRFAIIQRHNLSTALFYSGSIEEALQGLEATAEFARRGITRNPVWWRCRSNFTRPSRRRRRMRSSGA